MTKAFRNRWLTIALLWGVAMLLFWANLQTMNRARTARATWQYVQSNRDLVELNQESLTRVSRFLDETSMPVDTPELGFVYLERDLRQLAQKSGLSDFSMSFSDAFIRRGYLEVEASFRGGLEATNRWLSHLQSDFPYLQIQQIDLETKPEGRAADVKVSLNYRFRLNTKSD